MSHFNAVRSTRTTTIHLDSVIEEVFPLFGPVRESEWADGWQIETVYAATPLLEETGAVFQTRQHGDQPTIWIVLHFDRDQREISYARVTLDLHIATIYIKCIPSASGTDASITYTLTGLSEAGNTFIAQEFREAQYQHMMAQWAHAINHRLKTGQTLAHH